MPNNMLIDASHPEETRVVVLRGNRVEEFDFESASKKQLRGNIYLAKVMRVEPSLQAAFVDYGGNRHGFLAFSEIHPDYYQIPVADRQALIEEEARAQREEEEESSRPARRSRRHRRTEGGAQRAEKHRRGDATLSEAYAADVPRDAEGAIEAEVRPAEAPLEPADEAALPSSQGSSDEPERDGGEARVPAGETASERAAHLPDEEAGAGLSTDEEAVEAKPLEGAQAPLAGADSEPAQARGPAPEEGEAPRDGEDEGDEEAAEIEQIGGDALEEMPARQLRPRKQYKIQEVIKRRQVLLVQVVKEERGNKGAALTTYLSLAGRYSVLMPNTARGGGVSRKITDSADRQRLKAIAQELDVPEGMGVIVRTAGASRTKAEIKRDFEYLLRMWETVRETTLRSSAPKLVYEEGSLIKRSIRDLYNKDIDEIVVAGEEAYREAKEFMRLLMPSHAKMVQPYRDSQPMFAKYGVEPQLDAMFSNRVTLKSGGYIVINQAEALVAIDVNSGRSTREHNIEDTALRTNIEAAEEIARQLRLRDLAGLIVIDFIDMEESRNNRLVERRLKEALKNDRARIQVGRMSHFGLLEMSRQRMRTGVLEGSTIVCPHCGGGGVIRSTASIALHVLRGLEDALIKNSDYDVIVKTRTEVALYILNQKRTHLRDLEQRFGVSVTVAADDTLANTNYYTLLRGEPAVGARPAGPSVPAEAPPIAPQMEESEPASEMADGGVAEIGHGLQAEPQASIEPRGSDSEALNRQRRRRRRRRGRGGDREASGIAANAPQPPDDGLGAVAELGGLHTVPAQAAEVPSEGPLDAAGEPHAALQGQQDREESEGSAMTADTLRIEFVSEPEELTQGEPAQAAEEAAPGRRRRSRTPRAARSRHEKAAAAPSAGVAESPAEEAAMRPPAESEAEAPRFPAAGKAIEGAQAVPPEPAVAPEPPAIEPGPAAASPEQGEAPLGASQQARAEEPLRPKRTGWWQRARAGQGS